MSSKSDKRIIKDKKHEARSLSTIVNALVYSTEVEFRGISRPILKQVFEKLTLLTTLDGGVIHLQKPVAKMTNRQLENNCFALKKQIQMLNQYEEELSENEFCPICMIVMDNDTPKCKTTCNHAFCTPCFVRVVNNEAQTDGTAKCPMCRTHILPTPN